MSYATVLDALGDPTRRAIVEYLRDGPTPVGLLADRLPVSRPAVSRHLRVLSDAGLVYVQPVGSRHLYALNPEGLEAIRRYFDDMWAQALAALKQAAEDVPKAGS